MALKVLIPLPKTGFDPSETGIPWCKIVDDGHKVTVATPDGEAAQVDERMYRGNDLGIAKNLLMADIHGQNAYKKFQSSSEFQDPISYQDIIPFEYDAILLPGGHAPGMKVYLESKYLQQIVAWMMDVNRPVAAICHGVVLAARSRSPQTGQSVLFGRRTTALPKYMELSAWLMTKAWLGDYYRTYPQTVQDEVKAALEFKADFRPGPSSLFRDTPVRLKRGFVVRDGNYLSARWPGDAHRFAIAFADMLREEEQKI